MRLACVKHAASVRSEPGSNSQVHLSPGIATRRQRNQDINKQTRTHGLSRSTTAFTFRLWPSCAGTASKRTVTHKKDTRPNALKPNQRNPGSTQTQTAGPATRSAPCSRTKPEGAANVSLPSLCNCQRPERNCPQPRTIRAYRLTCSDVRQAGAEQET